MKKKAIAVLLILLLAALPVFSSACAPDKNAKQQSEGKEEQAKETSAGEQEGAAKGRYREELVSLPVPFETIFDVSWEEHTVRLMGENEPGSFYYCESGDSGAGWQKKDVPMDWLPKDYRVVSACFAKEGDVIVSAGKMSEDVLADQHAVGVYEYFRIRGTGSEQKVQSLSLSLPKPEEDYSDAGYGLSDLSASGEGKLYGILKRKEPGKETEGMMMSSQLYCFPEEGGEPLWSQEVGAGRIALSGNRIYLEGLGGSVQAVDADSGKELTDGKIPLEVRLEQADFQLGEDRIFYCDKTGIYGTDSGLAFRELLVDGTRSRFGNEIDYAVQRLCCISDRVFLVFVENTSLKKELLRYEYDENLNTEPEQELIVYSLKENDIVEKLIGDFQSSHPEAYVTYQVGLEQGANKTEADAINSLNTEIMAGNGPDVLILNNLPWEDYEEQGILEDFTKELALDLEEGSLFENLFLPYQKEGKQYAVPISFQIPVLVRDSQASEVTSLEELTRVIQKTEISPLYRAPKELLRYLASIYWQRIEQEGSVSKEELKNLLTEAEKIEEAIQEKGEEAMLNFISDETADSSMDFFANDAGLHHISDIAYGNTAMAMGYLGYLPDFVDMHNLGLTGCAISEHVFRSLLAGINRKSSSMDTAKEFLKFALSEEEQEIFTGTNFLIREFPVNRGVYEKMIQEPSAEKTEELYGNRYETWGRNLQLTFTWPGKEEFDRLTEMIENLSAPAMEDPVAAETVSEQGARYLSGEQGVDETVNEIVRILELYFAEKGIEL